MRAVVFADSLKFESDYPSHNVGSDTITVDVTRAGICETDLQLCRGYMGFHGILGHEFVGIARTGKFAGQRVVGEINCGCQSCHWCRNELENHCPDRTVVGILNHPGAFADSVMLPESNLHAIPEHVSDDAAVFVEPLAAACRIGQQVDLSDQPRVLVLGDGRLGNLSAQVLRHHGCDVLVRGRHEMKLTILRELAIAVSDQSTPLPEHAFDIVVDCTGSTSGLTDALRFVRPCGHIVMKTTVADPHSQHLAEIVINEIVLVGSRCGPFDAAVDLLASDSVTVEPLISAHFPLESAVDAFDYAARRDVLKVIFDIGSTA